MEHESLVIKMTFLQNMLHNDMLAERRWSLRVQEAQEQLEEAHKNRANTEKQILQLLNIYREQ